MTADLRALIGRTALAEATDADLLDRYATERDDLAFAELVHRHAPAVYAACRRFVSDPADLDDAFQAVFVLLCQKAGAIGDPSRLSGWLCGAAGRIARKLRGRSSRRTATETPLEAVPEPATSPTDPADLKAVLDEELTRLPAAYRVVVVLCDVDGVPRRTAANRLGIPESTLSNRLTRARAMLGGRLLRRGVALGIGLSLTSVAIASVPVKLVPLTVLRITTDTVSPDLLTLALDGSPPMLPLKTAGVFLVGLIAVGLCFVAPAAGETVKAPPPVAKKPVEADPPDPEPELGGIVITAAHSADGKWLALAEVKDSRGNGDNRLTIYDAKNWKVAHRIKRDDESPFAWSMQFSADGNTLYAVGADGTVRSWDTSNGKAKENLEAKTGRYGGLALSPDGKLLATMQSDPKNKEAKPKVLLLETATGKLVRPLETDETSVGQLAFTADSKSLAVAHSPEQGDTAAFHGVIEWDVKSGKEAKRFDAPRITPGACPIITQIAYTRDGKQLIMAGGEAVPNGVGCNTVGYLWVFDRKTGKLEKTLIENVRQDYVRQMTLSDDGAKLYVGTIVQIGPGGQQFQHVMQCWDTSTWVLDWSKESDGRGSAFALVASPNGKRIGVSNFGGFHLFDAKTGEPKGGLVKAKP